MGRDRSDRSKPHEREILPVDTLPIAEAAHAMVRKEAAHQIILGVTNETHGIATGLITGETDDMGLSTKGFRRFDGQKKPATRDDKSRHKCEECGMNQHTKDQCQNHRNSTKNSNDRRSEGGFGGVAATIKEEGEESFLVKVQGGTVMLAHETTEREAWLWHRRLGHPSMKLFFQSKGIVHQTTCPHTPEQNGVAERKNRLLLEMTRSLIIESHVPKSFWPEALATATYLINRLPT
nr:ribonuclease H-like domain-containing protein [Tanacetum cinerariifolium]